MSHIERSADVDPRAKISSGVHIWHLAQIREDASIGRDCVIGRGAYIDHDVVVGSCCKIQNYALIYHPATIGDGVFIGPAVQILNDPYPRATEPDGSAKQWTALGVVVEDGASIGAGSILLPGVTIGAWSMIGAGSIVTHDVPAGGLYRGKPATETGTVCKLGHANCETHHG